MRDIWGSFIAGIIVLAIFAVIAGSPQTSALISSVGSFLTQLVQNVVGTGAQTNG